MEILVCIKRVPAVMKIQLDPETNRLIRDGVPNILNPVDKNAIEAAVQLKEAAGGNVTVISMGLPETEENLREALAQGADKSYLISDKAFAGADSLATAKSLAAAANHLGKFDVVLCGDFSLDGSTGQVGPKLSEYLGLSLVSQVTKIELSGDKLLVDREHELGHEQIEAALPALITVAKEINVPRTPNLKSKVASKKAEIPVLTLSDIAQSEDAAGAKGSKTIVSKTFEPPFKEKGVMITEANAAEGAKVLMEKLIAAKFI